MEQYNRYLVISARILLATVFLLNGFGVINQAIPAKEVLEREVPPAIVPLSMIGGREVEVIAGFWPGLRGLPTFTCLALFRFPGSRDRHAAVSRPVDQLLEKLGELVRTSFRRGDCVLLRVGTK